MEYDKYCIFNGLNFFFFSSRRRHTRWPRDWSSDVCSSDLNRQKSAKMLIQGGKILRRLRTRRQRSEEHTSELQSRGHLVCRLLLEKKNIICNICKRTVFFIYLKRFLELLGRKIILLFNPLR